jgi:biopolymer transport protein ExbB
VIRRQWLSEQTVAMTFSLPMIKALIALCPLLGLLGTVLGMLEVFDVMTLRGQSDPRAMASGVSHAMIATLSGLAVSLSGMFFTGYFERRAAREGHDLALALEVKHHAL